MIRNDLLFNLWCIERAEDKLEMCYPHTPKGTWDDGKPKMSLEEFESSPWMRSRSQTYIDQRFRNLVGMHVNGKQYPALESIRMGLVVWRDDVIHAFQEAYIKHPNDLGCWHEALGEIDKMFEYFGAYGRLRAYA